MNFVIFPMFFASTALYPLWRLGDADPVLAAVARCNPFSHGVELIRFALYGQFEATAFAVTAATTLVALVFGAWRYDSGRILGRALRGGAAA
jgi:ABC-2 type transport system permease protein